MAKLGIHLQDGFDGDEVVVKVDGKVRLQRDGVTTRRVLGLAEHVELEVADGPLALEVAIPNRGLERTIAAEARGELHLGVSIAHGGEAELRLILRDTPFGYG